MDDSQDRLKVIAATIIANKDKIIFGEIWCKIKEDIRKRINKTDTKIFNQRELVACALETLETKER